MVAAARSDGEKEYAAFDDHFQQQFIEMVSAAESLSQVGVKRTGRGGNGIDHYLIWAVRYSRKIEMGVRNPHRELAKEHQVDWTYVRDTVTDARRRYGLLTDGVRGRAGGSLTAKARELLKERENAAKKEK
jgi:hypothetical protein